MNFTEEELRQIKSSPRIEQACSDSDRLLEIRELMAAYEREHLTPRNLAFEGALLPRIAQLAGLRNSTQKLSHSA